MKFINQIKVTIIKIKFKYLEWLKTSSIWQEFGFSQFRTYIYAHIYNQPIIRDSIYFIEKNIFRSKRFRDFIEYLTYIEYMEYDRTKKIYKRIAFVALLVLLQIIGWMLGGWFNFFVFFLPIFLYLVLWGNYNRWYRSFSPTGIKRVDYYRSIRRSKTQKYVLKKALGKKLWIRNGVLFKQDPKRVLKFGKTNFQEYQFIAPKELHWSSVMPKQLLFFNSLNFILRHHISHYRNDLVLDPLARTKKEQRLFKDYLQLDNKLILMENELRAQGIIEGNGLLQVKNIYSKEWLYNHAGNRQVILSCYALVYTLDEKSEAILALGPWYVHESVRKPWYVVLDMQIFKEALKASFQIGFNEDASYTIVDKNNFKFGEKNEYSLFIPLSKFKKTKWDRIPLWQVNRYKFWRTVRHYFVQWIIRNIYWARDMIMWPYYYVYSVFYRNTRRLVEIVNFFEKMVEPRKKPMGYHRLWKLYIGRLRKEREYIYKKIELYTTLVPIQWDLIYYRLFIAWHLKVLQPKILFKLKMRRARRSWIAYVVNQFPVLHKNNRILWRIRIKKTYEVFFRRILSTKILTWLYAPMPRKGYGFKHFVKIRTDYFPFFGLAMVQGTFGIKKIKEIIFRDPTLDEILWAENSKLLKFILEIFKSPYKQIKKRPFKIWLKNTLGKLITGFFKECFRLIPIISSHIVLYIKKVWICAINLSKVKNNLRKDNIKDLEGTKYLFTKINMNNSRFLRKHDVKLKKLSRVVRSDLIDNNVMESDVKLYQERLAADMEVGFNEYATTGTVYDRDILLVLRRLSRAPFNGNRRLRGLLANSYHRPVLEQMILLSELKKLNITPEVLDETSLKLHKALQQKDFLHLLPEGYEAGAMDHISDLFYGLTEFYNENNYDWSNSDKHLQDMTLFYYKWSAYLFFFYAQAKVKATINTEIEDVMYINTQYIKAIKLTKKNKRAKVGLKAKKKIIKTFNKFEDKYFKEIQWKLHLLLNAEGCDTQFVDVANGSNKLKNNK